MRGRRRGSPDQDRWERADWWGVVIDSPDPKALARFYSALLGWPLWKPDEMDPGEAAIDAGEGVVGITFHLKEDYVRPVWPNTAGEQQMMMHLDFEVSDLAEATSYAVAEARSETSKSRCIIICCSPGVFGQTGRS